MTAKDFDNMIKSCVRVRPIEWLESIFGYEYSYGAIFQYEVHPSGFTRYRKGEGGPFKHIDCDDMASGKKWCEDHHASEVLKLLV